MDGRSSPARHVLEDLEVRAEKPSLEYVMQSILDPPGSLADPFYFLPKPSGAEPPMIPPINQRLKTWFQVACKQQWIPGFR